MWKRSRKTTALVYQIRSIIREAGYDEELAVVPLAETISVLVRKGDETFNLRLNKESLSIVETHELKYNRKRDNVRMVFRRSV